MAKIVLWIGLTCGLISTVLHAQVKPFDLGPITAQPGTTVSAMIGSLLAVITDFFGKPLAEVRSPFSGIVLYVVATPPISQGEPVAMVGALRDK